MDTSDPPLPPTVCQSPSCWWLDMGMPDRPHAHALDPAYGYWTDTVTLFPDRSGISQRTGDLTPEVAA